MSGPSCRNTAIDDDLDLSDALNGRVAEILPNVKTYTSLVDVVDSFPPTQLLCFFFVFGPAMPPLRRSAGGRGRYAGRC